MHAKLKMAVVDANTLAALGLKQLLQSVVPIMSIDVFGSFAELTAGQADSYVHYFVALDIVLSHRSFFVERRHKTIVLTLALTDTSQLGGFHSLCVNQPERQLVHQLLSLMKHAHDGGRNLPPMPSVLSRRVLSDREAEVMALVVQGLINKEIAERLNIGLSTVITHRKNIMNKLGMHSVSALTIYAVMHGYVDINKI